MFDEFPLIDDQARARLHRIGGDELIERMIALFLAHSPERVDVAATSQDLDAVEKAAHGLKSTAGNLGAVRLQRVAEMLEARAGAGDSAECRALQERLLTVFEETRRALLAARRELDA